MQMGGPCYAAILQQNMVLERRLWCSCAKGSFTMIDKASVIRETNELTREISQLETQVKSLRDYIAAQERNLRGAADSVRNITERSLADARGDLYVKDLRLQQLRQELSVKQVYVQKLAAIDRKQQDIQTLERERDRIIDLLNRSQAELQHLMNEFNNLSLPSGATEAALIFASGERFPLEHKPEILIGCADATSTPDIDLTPLGGTTSGVSRRHAALRNTNGVWTITDLNSTNGTYVNGNKIAPNTPTPVFDQVKLRFGHVEGTFSVQSQPVPRTVRLN
jgi:hypothetical protein